MKTLYLKLLALSLAVQSPIQAMSSTPASLDEGPHPGHLEAMLSGSPGADLALADLDGFLPSIRRHNFLASASVARQSTLAPCSLLSAAMSSASMNLLFAGVNHPGAIKMFPPAGTNILGLYDADIARGKGGIPVDDPVKAADILARLVVWHSWGISTKLNTLIAPLSQGECLDLLADPDKFEAAYGRLKPTTATMAHTAPVSAYIASFDHQKGNDHLAELLRPGFLATQATSQRNPLSPGALLKAFRLAARLNDTWGKLTTGRFDTTGRPELAPYAVDLRNMPSRAMNPARKAEIMAAVFATEIVRTNDLTKQLTRNTTQRECLDEIFTPGTLRLKLLKDGITVPMR